MDSDYRVAVQMLGALGVRSVRLLSNNPEKAAQLGRAGIAVRELRRTGVYLTDANRAYIEAKVHRGGHVLELDQAGSS